MPVYKDKEDQYSPEKALDIIKGRHCIEFTEMIPVSLEGAVVPRAAPIARHVQDTRREIKVEEGEEEDDSTVHLGHCAVFSAKRFPVLWIFIYTTLSHPRKLEWAGRLNCNFFLTASELCPLRNPR